MTYPGVGHKCIWHAYVLEDGGLARVGLEDLVRWRKQDVVQSFPCCLLGAVPSACHSQERALALAQKVLVRMGQNCAKEHA